MPKLSIQIIVYSKGEEKYIPYLFDSLARQTFQDWEMVVVDNASDGTVLSTVEKHINELAKPYRIIKSGGNVGFAEGHNKGYASVKSDYVLLLNPDMYLMPDVLERMVEFLDKHTQASAVSTRLMRWDFSVVEDSQESELGKKAERGFTSAIDAIGIRLLRSRRSVECLAQYRLAKDSDSKDVQKIFDKPAIEVFGISGALPMFRKSSIDELLLPGGKIFDPTYQSYKEDLDLAYRMRNAGYTSYIILDTKAYHDRTSAGPKSLSDFAAARNKTKQSYYVRYHSYKNHIRTLIKNEYWQNFLLDSPFILWFELKKFLYLLITSPKVLFSGWREIIREWKYLMQARRVVHKSRKMYWKGIRRWFIV